VPELPEVETTRRGLAPLLVGRTFRSVEIRDGRLREPVPTALPALLADRRLGALERRAKYLLFRYAHGTLLLHLGMSGSLRLAPRGEPLRRHDHLRFTLVGSRELRFHDPRRFGLCVWLTGDPLLDARLARLGPEPLGDEFDGDSLRAALRGRKAAVKVLLMDPAVVVGVGNIYASEALFRAGIRPARAGGSLRTAETERLVAAVREVLLAALRAGGTTLRDYVDGGGEAGAFRVRLRVYGRAGEACTVCAAPIRCRVLGQRSTFWCPTCQG
jgi:formamidopyrimidine-DNA glycosylase